MSVCAFFLPYLFLLLPSALIFLLFLPFFRNRYLQRRHSLSFAGFPGLEIYLSVYLHLIKSSSNDIMLLHTTSCCPDLTGTHPCWQDFCMKQADTFLK